MGGEQLEIEAQAHDVFAQITGLACFGQRGFKALVAFEDFAVDIVVACFGAHGVAGDNHAFDQSVRVEVDDVAVFKCAGFTFVGVADNVFGAGERTGHKAPFQAGGEACAAAAAQAGRFHFGNHVVLRDFFAEDFAQGLIAAALHVFFQRPAVRVLGVHSVKNDA